MLYHHRKVFVYRFDLHVSDYTDNNKIITDFNRRLFKRIKRHYKVKRVGYGWVREMEKSKQQHYHYMLLLDGSKVNEPHEIQGWVIEIWNSLDGSVHLSRYHNIKRNDEASIKKQPSTSATWPSLGERATAPLRPKILVPAGLNCLAKREQPTRPKKTASESKLVAAK